MLTGYQCEVVAFQTDGEFICYDCAVKEWSTVRVEKIERGLDSFDVSPIIRYTLDEINGENAYEAARERVSETADLLGIPYEVQRFWSSYPGQGDDPVTVEQRDKYDRYHRLVDRLAEGLEEVYGECCGHCGEKLD